jgi:hypothetical protein
MKKLSDEELSRVLGEHDCGYLRVGGLKDWGAIFVGNRMYWGVYMFDPDDPCGCIEQVRVNSCMARMDLLSKEGGSPSNMRWFDDFYVDGESIEVFLKKLEKAGLA